MNIIEIRDVKKVYTLGSILVPALNGVSLSITNGEMVAIMGPSGSGKSTMMNLIGCLDVPSSGDYHLEGQNVGTMNDDQLAYIRNSKVGFVFQTYNLLPRLTALANVELSLQYGSHKNIRTRSIEALSKVGLSERTGHRPTELSGGEQQRVGIARALVKMPSILLADEPTGNLDSHSSNEIMAIIQNLNADGITIIIVTHEAHIAAHAQRIVTMRDGIITGDAFQKPEIAVSHSNITVNSLTQQSHKSDPISGTNLP